MEESAPAGSPSSQRETEEDLKTSSLTEGITATSVRMETDEREAVERTTLEECLEAATAAEVGEVSVENRTEEMAAELHPLAVHNTMHEVKQNGSPDSELKEFGQQECVSVIIHRPDSTVHNSETKESLAPETSTVGHNTPSEPSEDDRLKEAGPEEPGDIDMDTSRTAACGDEDMESCTCEQESPPDNSQPRYVLSDKLRLLTGSWTDYDDENYFRGCKWAPDGSCILTCSNDNTMRLFNLPTELYSNLEAPQLPEMRPVLSMFQRELVYDYCWYPRMNSWEPDTCCFLTSCKDHPIRLWDAFEQKSRASYVPYNHVDEVTSPHSLAFSLDGEKIYAGFRKCVKVFQLSRPGRECRSFSTYAKKKGGQNGIISAITMCPTAPKLYALGSYSCSIGLYSENVKECLMLVSQVKSGVTHMLFSSDGQTLYAGFRMDDRIEGWDLRNPGQVLHRMERKVHTNQRIYFDTFNGGRYLLSGDTSGCVHGWDLTGAPLAEGVGGEGGMAGEGGTGVEESLEPVLSHSCVHSDAINGTSVHPFLPILATCSGQRQFSLPADCGGLEEGEESPHPQRGGAEGVESQDVEVSKNCLMLWSL